jgi:hypothetical protein
MGKSKKAVERRVEPLVLLRAVQQHFDVGHAWPHRDAPGHSHFKKGVWDDTGKKCEWCETWEQVRTCVMQTREASHGAIRITDDE